MGAICNLVEEFNGLVSTEGSAFAGPLVFLHRLFFHQDIFVKIQYQKRRLAKVFCIGSLPLTHEQNQESILLQKLRI